MSGRLVSVLGSTWGLRRADPVTTQTLLRHQGGWRGEHLISRGLSSPPSPLRPVPATVLCAGGPSGARGIAPALPRKGADMGRGRCPRQGLGKERRAGDGGRHQRAGVGGGEGGTSVSCLSRASRDGRLVLPGLNWTRARVRLGRSRSQAGSGKQGPEVLEVRGTLRGGQLSGGHTAAGLARSLGPAKGSSQPRPGRPQPGADRRSPAPSPASQMLLVN